MAWSLKVSGKSEDVFLTHNLLILTSGCLQQNSSRLVRLPHTLHKEDSIEEKKSKSEN